MAITETDQSVTSGYVPVNGLSMYYEIRGAGEPLLLLHGGLTTINSSFGSILQALSASRKIIAVEQQAHGHTADIDRPLTFEQMADDTANLLRQLQIGPVDAFGYSDGGNVALGLAIRHPSLIRRIAFAGTNFTVDGLYPEVLEMLQTSTAEEMPDELRDEYLKVAPRPDDWPTLVSKVMELGSGFGGWSVDQLREIKSPTLIMVGDQDIVRPEHAVEMQRLIPNAQLAVLPGTDHGIRLDRPELLLFLLNEFLNFEADSVEVRDRVPNGVQS